MHWTWLLGYLAEPLAYFCNMLDLRIHCIRTIDNLGNNTKLPYHRGPFIALIDASPAKTVKEEKTRPPRPHSFQSTRHSLNHPVYRTIAAKPPIV